MPTAFRSFPRTATVCSAVLLALITQTRPACGQTGTGVVISEADLNATAETTVNGEKSFPGGPFSNESSQARVEVSGPGASIEQDVRDAQSLTSSADADVAANAYADEFIIRADAVIDASASLGPGDLSTGTGSLGVAVSFTVTEPTSAQLVGALELFPDGGDLLGTTGITSTATVSLIGISLVDPSNFFFFQDSVGFSDPAQRRETEFFQIIELQPDVQYSFTVTYGVAVTANDDLGTSDVDARGAFKCRLKFGDRDGDGLLDAWEEAGGIDINADDSIDIPLPDADPDRKNIYVEVDRFATANFNAGFVPLVEAAFAGAPGEFVQNADGSDGIIFRALLDEVIPGAPSYPEYPSEGLALSVATTTSPLRGRAQDRDAGNSEALLAAWSRCYRHCVWGGSIGGLAAGWGEVSGDQFIVCIDGFTTDAFPQPSFGASVFIHELGHNLGLLHGGGDSINRKPNYLSVMNVAQAYPGPYFKIDFSPAELIPLHENLLDEAAGLGPVPASLQGRVFPYNAAEAGQPRDRVDFVVGGPVDWDKDGTIGTATNRDLNRGPQSGSPGEVLYGFNDWSNMYIPIRGGDGNYGLGTNPGGRGGVFSNTGGGRTTEIYEEELSLFAARFYQQTVCEPDLDVDGDATFLDALVYLRLFDAGSSRADRDGDDDLDAQDVESFISDLDSGCP